MTIAEAHKKAVLKLSEIYDAREAVNITDLLIENITQLKRVDRFLNRFFLLNTTQQNKLENYLNDLIKHKPIQYVLNEVWFAGMKFYVNENVLIPRPETEELVEWVVAYCRFHILKHTAHDSRFTIFDIGTGSGCIAIALYKNLHIHDAQLTIHALDISENALHIAKQNAKANNAEINFFQANILDENEWKKFSKYDVIVSNPPYIKQSEHIKIHENILCYEPHLALFVNDEDAFIFYKKIAEFGLQHLNKNGQLFFEINENSGNEICQLLKNLGYKNIELKKDLQHKDRFIKAVFCQ